MAVVVCSWACIARVHCVHHGDVHTWHESTYKRECVRNAQCAITYTHAHEHTRTHNHIRTNTYLIMNPYFCVSDFFTLVRSTMEMTEPTTSKMLMGPSPGAGGPVLYPRKEPSLLSWNQRGLQLRMYSPRFNSQPCFTITAESMFDTLLQWAHMSSIIREPRFDAHSNTHACHKHVQSWCSGGFIHMDGFVGISVAMQSGVCNKC